MMLVRPELLLPPQLIVPPVWPFGGLRMFGYDVIVADPPWDFETYSEEGWEKSAHAHYECLSVERIMAFPVHLLARDRALLLMYSCGWAVANGDAQRVARAWGFEPVTLFNWKKVTKNGKVRLGPGYRVRTTDEPILVCKIGNPKHKPFRSFDGIAREHSRKPDEFYQQVLRCTPNAFRADLFSRETRAGFDGWGLEHGKFDPGYMPPTEIVSDQVVEDVTAEPLPDLFAYAA